MFPTLAMRESLIQRIAARLLGELEQVGGGGLGDEAGGLGWGVTRGAGGGYDTRGWRRERHTGAGGGYDTRG